jgi:large subunit ribosomal protein L24
MRGEPGGIVAREAPIQTANVAIFNPATGKADRVGIRVLEDGSRVRFYKKTGETIAG